MEDFPELGNNVCLHGIPRPYTEEFDNRRDPGHHSEDLTEAPVVLGVVIIDKLGSFGT